MTGTAVDWLRRGCDVGRLNRISKFYIYIASGNGREDSPWTRPGHAEGE